MTNANDQGEDRKPLPAVGPFSAIPEPVQARMRALERIDGRDKVDGTEHDDRLRQVPPDTGRFLSFLALLSPDGPMLELGTSGGYSTLWLALACRQLGRTLTTCEHLPGKAALARETIHQAGVSDVVHLVEDDALKTVRTFERLAFCFLDCDKSRSLDYYREVLARLAPGGLFLVDNAISHAERMADALNLALTDPRVDAVVVPVGKGVLVSRRSG